MKHLLAIFLVCAPLGLSAQTAPPHALDGVWQTGARDGSWGFVRFAPCGPAYCGTLVGGGGREVNPGFFGEVMVTGMAWDGAEFSGGRLRDVENDRVYLSRMRFEGPDRLSVAGCVLGGLVCGRQTWVRVE